MAATHAVLSVPMDGRQRLGVVLVVAGIGLALVGMLAMVAGRGGTAVATASPSASAGPATAAPSAVPATTPSAAPTEDVTSLVRAFLQELQASIRNGTQETMAGSLGQATLDRYGLEACAANLSAREPAPERAFEIVGLHEPAPWDYVTDDLTTTVPNTTTVDARVTEPNASGAVTTQERELHVQVIGGKVYWFTDCGTPLG